MRRRQAAALWFAGKPMVDDQDRTSVTVGEHKADVHYEDAVATFWGDNHDAAENAKLAVESVAAVPEMKELAEAADTELVKLLLAMRGQAGDAVLARHLQDARAFLAKIMWRDE